MSGRQTPPSDQGAQISADLFMNLSPLPDTGIFGLPVPAQNNMDVSNSPSLDVTPSAMVNNFSGVQKKKRTGKKTKRSSKQSVPIPSNSRMSCANCSAVDTPLWRKGDAGQILCNKCGLYWSRHAQHRPQKLERTARRGSEGGSPRRRNSKQTALHEALDLAPPALLVEQQQQLYQDIQQAQIMPQQRRGSLIIPTASSVIDRRNSDSFTSFGPRSDSTYSFVQHSMQPPTSQHHLPSFQDNPDTLRLQLQQQQKYIQELESRLNSYSISSPSSSAPSPFSWVNPQALQSQQVMDIHRRLSVPELQQPRRSSLDLQIHPQVQMIRRNSVSEGVQQHFAQPQEIRRSSVANVYELHQLQQQGIRRNSAPNMSNSSSLLTTNPTPQVSLQPQFTSTPFFGQYMSQPMPNQFQPNQPNIISTTFPTNSHASTPTTPLASLNLGTVQQPLLNMLSSGPVLQLTIDQKTFENFASSTIPNSTPLQQPSINQRLQACEMSQTPNAFMTIDDGSTSATSQQNSELLLNYKFPQ